MGRDEAVAAGLPERGARLLVGGQLVTVIDAVADGDYLDLVIRRADGKPDDMKLTATQLADSLILANDGRGDPVAGLAGLWARWMQYAVPRIRSAVLATRPLRPYAHQDEAVFGHMLAQPRLRFLLADEPGTGKTVMTGMYLAEATRRGLIQGRTIIVVPKHLVAKWQRDLLRHFAIDARRLTAEVARDPADLDPRYNVWVVSIDLFTRNGDVRRRIAGPDTSWSLAVFDEAHRLTPTSQYLGAAQDLSARAHHLLLLTATPHRGKEHFFRALLNLLDAELYPWDPRTKAYHRPLRPSNLSFLRRMKEDLRDFDGAALFPPRYAEVVPANLNSTEGSAYREVMGYVDTFFADNPTLPRSVYGRRAASSLVAVEATLQRRWTMLEGAARERMGDLGSADLLKALGPEAIDDEETWDRAEQAVISARSQDLRAELASIGRVLSTIRLAMMSFDQVAKWRSLQELLARHSLAPNMGQLLVFTEFTDTARWLADLFRRAGFSTETLEGSLDHVDRDVLQQRFLAGRFQVLVSTDAGGEGIDLQSAHVMVNWDIPWSLVRLEQRMGRLHRIGQRNEVYIYHLVSPNTREGRVQRVLLDNINEAGQALGGRIHDLLDAAAERVQFDYTSAMVSAQAPESAAEGIHVPNAEELRTAVDQLLIEERRLSTREAALNAAERRFRDDRLEAVNPVIVDGFVDRLAGALDWRLSQGPAPGIRHIRCATAALPAALRGGRDALIAADALSVSQARSDGAVGLEDVITLGPTEPAFTELVDLGIAAGDPAIVRGVRLIDQASHSGYTVFAFAAEVLICDEVGRRTYKNAPLLVRHSGRDTFLLSWEAVLKLVPDGREAQAVVPPPGVRADAEKVARRELGSEVVREKAARESWINRIRSGLDEVEIRFQDDIESLPMEVRGRRMRSFERLRAERLAQLDELSDVQSVTPRLLGWAEVLPGATAELGYDPDSELVAIQVVWAELDQLGFDLDDRQTAGLGYDLLARHRRTGMQRLVEVKGQLNGLEAVWLEQNEWAQAQQHGAEYWLYVVTHCATEPMVSVRAKDPAAQVGTAVRRIERYQIPVTDLRRMAGRGQV